tara:strand:- start:32 stop:670 length:639 start_codon:yes stop_codon:yes gene_type:complete
MAKWKLILDDTYIVSKSGRVQVADSIWSKPKNRDLPNFWNATGDLAVMIDYQKEKKNISVARLVAHAFVDEFDMFNTNHELRLIDTSKRPKLKNIKTHVPQNIPQLEWGVHGDKSDATVNLFNINEEESSREEALTETPTKTNNLKVYLIEDLRAGDIYEDCNGEWWKVEYITTKKINSTRVNDMYDTQDHSITEVKTVCFLDCAQLKKTLA